MEGPVTWQALLLLVSATLVINSSTALFVGWLVWRACQVVSTLESRIMRLELLMDGRVRRS